MRVHEDRAAAWARGLAAAVLLLGCGAPWAQQPVSPRAAQCAACHGAQGNSREPLIPSLAGQPRQFIENQLVLIREGLRDIPQMKGVLQDVKDEEIAALAGYFSAQVPAGVTAQPQTGPYQRGLELSRKMHCASCHLPDFSGRQQIPRLAGQHEPYLLQAMQQFRDHSGLGRDTIMAASLYGLKDAELADLAHYLTHFRP